MRKTNYIWVALIVSQGCVEQFQAETQTLETLLVVDGLITDELKRHEVALTRVFAFEEEDPTTESGASVEIVDNEGARHVFEEVEPGRYLAQLAFRAEQGKAYTLEIATNDGNTYRSDQVNMPKEVPITDLNAKRVTNDQGEEGVSIVLDNVSETNSPSFFRYEYEETYKIIAPNWDPFDFEVVYYTPCTSRPYQVDIITGTGERRVCFASNTSTNLIQASTVDLVGNGIVNKEIRFLSRDNYIISHRYSIRVKQFAQTPDAHSFYERLGDFSSSDNVFSQIQPGFLEGNITASQSGERNVLGYFEVASVTEKRMYFNYEDLFPGEELPPYALDCSFMGNPPLYSPGYHCDGNVCDGDCESPLIEAILAGLISYAATNEGDFNRPYFTWARACGDCTVLGSNIVPEFWEE